MTTAATTPVCPKCHCDYTYADGDLIICPECAYEWQTSDADDSASAVIKDANGNILADGDSVTVIKDLKIKGSSLVVKVGSKAKSIRLLPDATDGHDIDCKIDGIGSIKLKSEFVKKA